MRPSLSSQFAVAVTFLAAVPAQRTWVVSAAGGSGVDFTDIPPAVAAAADGDILDVRPGRYAALTLSNKGLSVIGQVGVQVANLSVANLTASQRAVITDVDVIGPITLFPFPGARDCRGMVLLERVTLTSNIANPSFANCDDLRLSQCQVLRPTGISACHATITDSLVAVSLLGISVGPTLTVSGGTLMLSRTSLVGQSEFLRTNVTPALSMAGAVVRVTDDGSNTISAGAATTQVQPSAVVGSGTFLRDPRVRVLAGSAPPISGPTEIVQAIATLRALGAVVGSNVEVELSGAVGEPFALVLGLPGPPIPLPQFGGSLGLATLSVVTQGVFTATPFALSFPVSPGLPAGFAIAWQAIAGDTRGGWQLTNVATYARTR